MVTQTKLIEKLKTDLAVELSHKSLNYLTKTERVLLNTLLNDRVTLQNWLARTKKQEAKA